MEVSPVRHVKESRKAYPCDWCYETIPTGSSYSNWFTYGEAVTARMHPECFSAQCKAVSYDEELPTPGTYRRGCWCGEDFKFCKCQEKEKV